MPQINSLKELEKFRNEELAKGKSSNSAGKLQVIVGFGSCGIAVGASETMNAVIDFINKNKVKNVLVSKAGCIGLCEQEPILQIVKKGSEKISYGKVSPEIAEKIMKSFVVGGNKYKKNLFQT